jgi:hypothetical protein
MNNHPVDMLIRLAWLEGLVRTRGAYERAVARRLVSPGVGTARASALEERLVAALPPPADPSDAAASIGEWLRAVPGGGGTDAAEIRRRLGLHAAEYRKLERDELSPPDLPVEFWRRFRDLFALPADVLEHLLRGTHRLVVFRPAFRAAMARHRPGAGEVTRREDLRDALRTLYLHADLEMPGEEERRIGDLIRALQ